MKSTIYHYNLIVYGDSIKSQHLNVTLNETVVLQCNSDGIQSEMIQWLWNGSTIDLTVSIAMYACICTYRLDCSASTHNSSYTAILVLITIYTGTIITFVTDLWTMHTQN